MIATTTTITGAVSHRRLQPGEWWWRDRSSERLKVVSHDGYTLVLRQPTTLERLWAKFTLKEKHQCFG